MRAPEGVPGVPHPLIRDSDTLSTLEKTLLSDWRTKAAEPTDTTRRTEEEWLGSSKSATVEFWKRVFWT